MNLLRSYSYSTVDKEDPDEMKHRRAQFLIYRELEKADSIRKRSILRLTACRIKIKVGARLKRIGKRVHFTIKAATRANVRVPEKFWSNFSFGSRHFAAKMLI